MSSEPLVSICIPAYNAETYIRDSLNSALNQTYQNTEIICVDDGSTDSTPTILREFESDIHILRGGSRGAPAARNLALSHAKGKFIQFLDADDMMHSRKIEFQISPLISGDADMVFCNKQILYDDGTIVVRPPAPSTYELDPLIYCLLHNVPGKRAVIDTEVPLHRKELLGRINGFRLGVRRGQDKDLALRLAAAGARFKYIDEVLTTVREHSGPRISHNIKSPGYNLDLLIDILKIVQLEPQYMLNAERQKAYALALIKLSKRTFRDGGVEEAKRGFSTAVALHPKGETNEHSLYKLVRTVIGYTNTEMLLSIIQ